MVIKVTNGSDNGNISVNVTHSGHCYDETSDNQVVVITRLSREQGVMITRLSREQGVMITRL